MVFVNCTMSNTPLGWVMVRFPQYRWKNFRSSENIGVYTEATLLRNIVYELKIKTYVKEKVATLMCNG